MDGRVSDELPVVFNASDKGVPVSDVGGHRHSGEGGDFLGIRGARGEDGISQEVGTRGTKFGLAAGMFEVAVSEPFEDGIDVMNMGIETSVRTRRRRRRRRQRFQGLEVLR